jgi:hypothetical protein
MRSRATATDLALALAAVSNVAQDLAWDLANTLDSDLTRDLYLARASRASAARADDLARARALARELTLVRDLAGAVATEVASTTSDSTRELDLDLALANNRDLDVALTRAIARACKLIRAGSRASNCDLARDLSLALTRAHGLTLGLASELEEDLGRVCRGLVAAAVRVLPAGHRARYAHEWRADLWHIGQQSRRRWHQLGYAAGVLSQSVALRRGLTSPVPGRAANAGPEG